MRRTALGRPLGDRPDSRATWWSCCKVRRREIATRRARANGARASMGRGLRMRTDCPQKGCIALKWHPFRLSAYPLGMQSHPPRMVFLFGRDICY